MAGNFDWLSGYGEKQNYAIRYSPPVKSEPWPMPQVFIGFDNLFPLNVDKLEFNFKVKGGKNCPTLQQIVDRYRKGLLLRSARSLSVDNPILRPGSEYVPMRNESEIEYLKQLAKSNSFFERKVLTRINKQVRYLCFSV